jgi:sarcosine oxidase subunit beta
LRERAEVVVVGGGIVGTTVALRLAERGVRDVVLLEARAIASGPTGLSTGVVRQFYLLPEMVAMAREGLEWYGRFADHVEGGEAGFVRSGLLVVGTAAQRELFEQAVQLQEPYASGSRVLDPEGVRALVPHLAVEDVGCGYFEPEAGFADPPRAAIATASAAAARGVRVEPQTPVLEVTRDRTGVTGVVTGAGRLATRTVVCAAGPWTPRVAASVGVRLPIQPSYHQVIVVQRPEGLPQSQPVVSDTINMVYLRPESAAHVLIGSTDPNDAEATEDPDAAPSGAAFGKIAGLFERASRRVRSLERSALVAEWAGIYDQSPDGFPLLGEVEQVPGFYVAAGLSGHGFKLAPAISRMLVAAILDCDRPPAMRLLRVSRFDEGDAIDSPTTTTLTAMRAV